MSCQLAFQQSGVSITSVYCAGFSKSPSLSVQQHLADLVLGGAVAAPSLDGSAASKSDNAAGHGHHSVYQAGIAAVGRGTAAVGALTTPVEAKSTAEPLRNTPHTLTPPQEYSSIGQRSSVVASLRSQKPKAIADTTSPTDMQTDASLRLETDIHLPVRAVADVKISTAHMSEPTAVVAPHDSSNVVGQHSSKTEHANPSILHSPRHAEQHAQAEGGVSSAGDHDDTAALAALYHSWQNEPADEEGMPGGDVPHHLGLPELSHHMEDDVGEVAEAVKEQQAAEVGSQNEEAIDKSHEYTAQLAGSLLSRMEEEAQANGGRISLLGKHVDVCDTMLRFLVLKHCCCS